MAKERDIEAAGAAALVRCLAEVPFLRVKRQRTARRPGQPDIAVRVTTPDGQRLILAECKSSGQPRLAREGINQLLRYRNEHPDAYVVFIAPYISPRTAELCREHDVGYLDLAGNYRLSFDYVFIQKSGQTNRFAEKRDLRSLYSPKASRVLRVLLDDPRRLWKVQDLAEEAGVSIGQASNVKKLLSDREWIDTGPDGIRLREPGTLLAEWAENQRRRKDHRYECYSLEPGQQVEQRLAQVCASSRCRYALTGFSASLRYAPMVRAQRVTAYVTGNIERLMARLELKPVSSGANVTLIKPGDEGVFYGQREIDDLVTVSPVQAYLDLVGAGGRGDEAAKAILDTVIRPQW